jgi:hypothetical protein
MVKWIRQSVQTPSSSATPCRLEWSVQRWWGIVQRCRVEPSRHLKFRWGRLHACLFMALLRLQLLAPDIGNARHAGEGAEAPNTLLKLCPSPLCWNTVALQLLELDGCLLIGNTAGAPVADVLGPDAFAEGKSYGGAVYAQASFLTIMGAAGESLHQMRDLCYLLVVKPCAVGPNIVCDLQTLMISYYDNIYNI